MKLSFEPRWSIFTRRMRRRPAPRNFAEYQIFLFTGLCGGMALFELVRLEEWGWCLAMQIVAAASTAITGWIVAADLRDEWRQRREVNLISVWRLTGSALLIVWILGAALFVPRLAAAVGV